MGEENDEDGRPKKFFGMSRAMYETQSMFRKQKDIKHKEYHKIFLQWRFYDLMTSIFANLGLIVAIIMYEIDVKYQVVAITAKDMKSVPYNGNAMETPRFTNTYNIASRWIICGTSFIAIVFLIKRYQLKTRWVNHYFNDLLLNYRVD